MNAPDTLTGGDQPPAVPHGLVRLVAALAWPALVLSSSGILAAGFALPALALYHVHRAPLDISFLQAELTSWVMLGMAGIAVALYFYFRRKKWL